MTKKPETKPAKPIEPPTAKAKAETKPKAHSSKPSTNPFLQQHPGSPGRASKRGK